MEDYLFHRKRMCESMHRCSECPMTKVEPLITGFNSCFIFETSDPYLAEAVVLKWSKEHPLVTNYTKLKSVFPALSSCTTIGIDICPKLVKSNIDCDMIDCINCKKNFWTKPLQEDTTVKGGDTNVYDETET